jgi:Fe-S-cluster containining protein
VRGETRRYAWGFCDAAEGLRNTVNQAEQNSQLKIFIAVISRAKDEPECFRAMRYSRHVGSRTSPTGDQKLIQIVDSALADATRRSGNWLACRPGCTQCCVGVFAINQLDAVRLQKGLAGLKAHAPKRAEAVRERARAAVNRLSHDFPGNILTGVLDESEEAQERFEEFGNDEPCPALDPHTGLCELYESRPMTCRVFGPPVRSEEGLGVCELCFQGATDEQIAACEMKPDPDDMESRVLAKVEKKTGTHGNTIIAFCLAR